MSLEDRWFVLGTTGTGKTTFARELVERMRRGYKDVPLYILDSKAVGDFTDWDRGAVFFDSPEPPDPIEKGVQIWQPGVDDMHAFDEWFRLIRYSPGPAMVLLDEVSSLSTNSKKDAPHYLQVLLKQGRALGKMVISCTQEMAGVPKQIKSQTTHIVRFRMGDGYDKRESHKLMHNDGDSPEPTAEHGFFYTRVDRPYPVEQYATYKDFF